MRPLGWKFCYYLWKTGQGTNEKRNKRRDVEIVCINIRLTFKPSELYTSLTPRQQVFSNKINIFLVI